jgi:flagellar assembly factor FliW
MSSVDNSEVLRLKTSRFGEVECPRSSVVTIFAGLIGFPQFKDFVLIEYTAPFSWLQSTENPDLAFVVVNAAEFGESYSFDLPLSDRELDLTQEDEVAIFNIVSIRSDPRDSTVNLKAPVVVNLRNRKGRQVILDDNKFPTRMPLWAEQQPAESNQSAEGDNKEGDK